MAGELDAGSVVVKLLLANEMAGPLKAAVADISFSDDVKMETALSPMEHRARLAEMLREEEAEEFWGSRDGAPPEILSGD